MLEPPSFPRCFEPVPALVVELLTAAYLRYRRNTLPYCITRYVALQRAHCAMFEATSNATYMQHKMTGG